MGLKKMAMFGTAIRQISGVALAAVAFFGASIAANAITYQIEDLKSATVVGSFEADDTGAVTSIMVTVGGETYTSLASGSDALEFDAATGALNATGSGYTALTNGSGSFFRIINTMVGGKLMLEWDLLTGASYDTADLVSYGHYQVNPVAGSTVSSVPVPASIIMLGTLMVGAGAFAATRRRKRA